MKNTSLLSIFMILLLALAAHGRDLPVIEPTIGAAPDLSEKAQKEFDQWKKLIERMNKGGSADELTKKEKELLERYGESEDRSFWATADEGCSWYCGGGPEKVTASSQLKPAGDNTYDAKNAHDFSFKTAWVEGVPGYGAGEYLEYLFKNESPRVTDILIYNGYLKSEAGWKKNSRVKRLKLSVNGRPFVILDLRDTRALQTFKLPGPLGRTSNGKDMVLRFEILDVYKGDAYDDTAITELFFDGLDVHCLAPDTRVATPDGERPIVALTAGDRVLQYDPGTDRVDIATVTRVVRAKHDRAVALRMEDGTRITATADHPFWIIGKGWSSHQPERPGERSRYQSGDRFLLFDSGTGAREVRLQEVIPVDGYAVLYTLELDRGAGFIANGLVTGTGY